MKLAAISKIVLPILVVLSISSCNLSRSPVPTGGTSSPAQTIAAVPTALPTQLLPALQATQVETTTPTSAQTLEATVPPTQAPVRAGTATSAPPKALSTTPYPAPTAKPTLPTTVLPTAASSASNLPVQGSYAVVLVPQGETLVTHASASAASEANGKLAYNAKNLTPTSQQTQTGGQIWMQLNLPGSGQGWVPRANLTEYVTPDTFCKDKQVDQLIGSLAQTLKNKDSSTFPNLVSPLHGLSLQLIRGGTVANYDLPKAAWVLQSTYVVDWGAAPGSGLAVRGSFNQEVLPKLMDVLNGQFTKTCNKIVLGGATYQASWPATYENINYVSLYRPAPTGKEQDWRTWVLGIEYLGGKPYLFSLNQYAWEP